MQLSRAVLFAALAPAFFAAAAPAADDPFAALVRPTEPLSPEAEQSQLRPPPGFEVQLFAAEPQINKPINIAFDARGRMWVSSTVEYPFAAETDRWVDPQGSRVRDSRDAIKILDDTDDDGRADKVIDFADGLNIPIGVLPYGRGCIAWSIPNIWYFEDTDGDDRCDRRTVLFGPLGYDRDVHGNIASLRLGPDGWVYATHGFNNQSRFEVRSERLAGRKLGDPGTVIELHSGNTFRFRPDGSAIEVWSRGQVNPFGMCFDSWGQMFTADCHSDPITQVLRGAYYPSFGKPHDGLGFGPVVCPHRHGSTGLCGVEIIERGIWGTAWDGVMLVGNCVTSKINCDEIRYTGSTAKLEEQPDFLTSDDPWFRPVDLRLGPDGALYVADFYNRIIGHYEVDRKHPGRDRERGRIWRIVRTADGGAKPPATLTSEQQAAAKWRWNRSSELKVAGIVATITDATCDSRVRRQAAEALAFQPSLGNIEPLWSALLAAPADDPALRHTLRIAVRNHLQLAGAWDEWRQLDLSVHAAADDEITRLILALESTDAAEWHLNRLAARPTLPADSLPMIASLARRVPPARHDELVEFVRTRAGKGNAEPLALLQSLREGFAARGGPMPPSLVAWAKELAGQLLDEVAEDRNPAWQRVAVPADPGSASPWASRPYLCADGGERTLLTSLPKPGGGRIESQVGLLASRALTCPNEMRFWLAGHRGFPTAVPHDLNFVRLLDVGRGTEIVRAYPPRHDQPRLVVWDLKPHAGRQVRLELVDGDIGTAYAWLAVGGFEGGAFDTSLSTAGDTLLTAAELVRSFGLAEFRPRFAEHLKRAELSDDTLAAVAELIATDPSGVPLVIERLKNSPWRLQTRLAETLAGTKPGAGALVDGAPPRLLTVPVVAQKLAVVADAELKNRIAERTKNLPSPQQEIENVILTRRQRFDRMRYEGRLNAESGKAIFTKYCSACHQVAGIGKQVGPQLDGLKARGAERLCEDILDPNRAVDPAFRRHVLTMADGLVVSALIRRDEGQSLVVVDDQGKERTLAKRDIEERTETGLSLMPAGYDKLLTEEEFETLLYWLLER